MPVGPTCLECLGEGLTLYSSNIQSIVKTGFGLPITHAQFIFAKCEQSLSFVVKDMSDRT